MKPSTPASRCASSSEFIEVRGRRCHVRTWGEAGAPQMFLLHGWMDVSASFQFVVSALKREWRVIAPDWRGFGPSQRNDDTYWFPDYVADLECVLERYSPEHPVRLVGHSLGGNAACLYAGVRPQRVSHLATLEGFGVHYSEPPDAAERYAKWLDALRAGCVPSRYTDRAELAATLRRRNPRLTEAQAAFLALHIGEETQPVDGKTIVVAADPYHKLPGPLLYHVEDAKACWRKVTARVLWVAAADSWVARTYRDPAAKAEYANRIACFRDIRVETIAESGHNIHHDQPERLAELLEDFFL